MRASLLELGHQGTAARTGEHRSRHAVDPAVISAAERAELVTVEIDPHTDSGVRQNLLNRGPRLLTSLVDNCPHEPAKRWRGVANEDGHRAPALASACSADLVAREPEVREPEVREPEVREPEVREARPVSLFAKTPAQVP